MGCGSSTAVHIISAERLQRYDPTYESSHDLKVTIPKKFAVMDESGDGELDYPEFCAGFQFESTPLTRKLFEAFDTDGSRKISLVEFIAGLRNWQNFSYDDKIKFTYKIYDLDGSALWSLMSWQSALRIAIKNGAIKTQCSRSSVKCSSI